MCSTQGKQYYFIHINTMSVKVNFILYKRFNEFNIQHISHRQVLCAVECIAVSKQ